MDLNKVFNDFCDKLSERKEFMTEDNIRYYWFVAMYEQDKELNHYILEKPYEHKEIFEPELKLKPEYQSEKHSRKELDLFYDNGSQQWAMEMKFHRYSPKSAFAHPDAAGAIFSDIFRLQFAPTEPKHGFVRRFLLYVTDDEMDAYLNRGSGGKSEEYRKELQAFYGKKSYKQKRFFDGIDSLKTFKDSAFSSFKKNTHDLYYNNRDTLFPTPEIRLVHKKDNIQTNSRSCKEGEVSKGETYMCHVRLYEVLSSVYTENNNEY